MYMAQGRVHGVQHVRGHDPGPGDHGTLSARTNPPGGSGFGGKLRHPPSHLTEAILRAMDWHQQAASLWRWDAGLVHALPPQIPAPLHEQSGAPALFALRESPVGRMAPSPFDITSVARQPMDCRRSEVPIVLQSKTRSGNTAIRRQNVIN
jgi:hypothetical protein